MTSGKDASFNLVDRYVPKEYQFIFQQIPSLQLRYFMRKLHDAVTARKGLNREVLLDVILATLDNLMSPAVWWWYLLGRIALETSREDVLVHFVNAGIPKKGQLIISSFLQRLKLFMTPSRETSLALAAFLPRLREFFGTDLIYLILEEEIFFALGFYSFQVKNQEQIAENLFKIDEIVTEIRENNPRIPKELLTEFQFHKIILQLGELILSNDSKKALSHVTKHAHVIEQVHDSWLKALYNELLMRLHETQDNIEDLLTNMQLSFNEYLKSSDYVNAVEVGVKLIRLLIQKGELARGEHVAETVSILLNRLEKYVDQVMLNLTLAKAHVNMNERKMARKYLQEAEKLITEKNLRYVPIHVITGFLWMQLAPDLEIVDLLQRTLTVESENSAWRYLAQAIIHLIEGNLNAAEKAFVQAQSIAEEQGDLALDLETSYFKIELYLKLFLLDYDAEYLRQALSTLSEIEASIKRSKNVVIALVFYLILYYLEISSNNVDLGSRYLKEALQLKKTTSFIRIQEEIEVASRRLTYLQERSDNLRIENADARIDPWMMDNSIRLLSIMEAMRLLRKIQFWQYTIGEPHAEKKVTPYLLLIVRTSDGLPVFTYDFGTFEFSIDQDALISAVLALVTKVGNLALGSGGQLRFIEQDRHAYFMIPLDQNLLVVLIASSDSYLARKHLRRYKNRLINEKMVDFLASLTIIEENHANWEILRRITRETFASLLNKEDRSKNNA